MSERARQEAIAAAIAPHFAEGSVLINDHETPQRVTHERAPWAIIGTADELIVLPGESWHTPSAEYRIYLTLLDYRGNRKAAALFDSFQELRQNVISSLLDIPHLVTRIEANTLIAPYFAESGEPEPDSIAQALVIHTIDYEV